ncbi:hypothetical protein ACQ4PT_052675 [Festuca glaucescens]
MVSERSSSGRGGGQIGRGGSSPGRGESSSGGGGSSNKTEARKVASDAARLRGSYRYLKHAVTPPPAFLRWESAAIGPLAVNRLDQKMPFGRKLTQDAGGSEEHEDAEVERDDEADFSDDDNVDAGGGDEDEESTEQDAGKSAKQPLLDEVQGKKGISNPVATKSNPLADAFGIVERDSVDLKIMQFIAANGIPFNVMSSPQYYEMVSAIKQAPKDYKPPSYEKARTTLLDACKTNVEKQLAPVRETWYTQGVSIVSDGWTNVKNEALINVIASNSRGSMFLYAEDFSGTEKTGENIAQFLLKAIDEIGPSNVLQVVTDNASNCKAAGKEIEKVHKHIFWSPCVVHTLNLIFKDLANACPWIVKTYKAGKQVVKYILNHQHCLTLFRSKSKLNLLKVAKTRFASHYILLKRLKDCREALALTVATIQWKEWAKAGDQHARTTADLITRTINDDVFWDEVDVILSITKPLYLLIKFGDGEGSKVAEIYEKMDTMVGEIKDVMSKKDNPHRGDLGKVNKIILDRWGKMNWTFHCLAFALCPKYYDPQYLATNAPGGIARKAPNQDKEVMVAVLEAFEKISEDTDEQNLLRSQLNTFVMKKGLFALPQVQLDAVTMNPIDWWFNYGAETPELAEVAKKVLSQPISSSSAERNWSTYSFIHSVKRNRLNAKTADKLVYIHANIRLISRFCESYKTGPHCRWDMDPDNSSLEESSLKLEELRWKYLEGNFVDDEPSVDVDDETPVHEVREGYWRLDN